MRIPPEITELSTPKRILLLYISLSIFIGQGFVVQYSIADPNDSQKEATEKATEQFRFAEGMRNREFYDLAATEYKRIIRNYPNFEFLPEALFYQGDCLRISEKYVEALEVYRKLLDRYPKHALTHQASITVASILLEDNKLDEAERILSVIAKNNSVKNHIREAAFYYLGEVYTRKEQVPEAVAHYSKISSKDLSKTFQYRAFSLLNLGYLYRNMENMDSASKCFNRLVENETVSESIKEESIFQLGEIAYSQSELIKAVRFYKIILTRFSQGTFASNATVNLGWAYLKLEQYQDLQKLLDPTLLKDENITGESLYIYGFSLKQVSRFKSALEIFDRMAREFQNSEYMIYAAYDSVECLFELNQLEQCLDKISDFIKRFPSSKMLTDIYFLKSRCLLSLNKLDDASKALEEILTKIEDGWQYEEEALMVLAETYRKLNKFQRASFTYKRLLDLNNPKINVKALMLAAECETLDGDLDKAVKTYKVVLTDYSESPEVPIVLLYLGEVLTNQKNYVEAIEFLNRFIRDFPKSQYSNKALYLRGTLHHYLENYPAALNDLNKSIDLAGFDEIVFAKLFLTYTLWELKREDEALEIFEELVKSTNDEFNHNLNPDLLSEMGGRYILINHLTAAEKCFSILAKNSTSEKKIKGLIGLAKIEFHKDNFIKASKLFYDIKAKTAKFPELGGIATAFLGEALRKQNKNDEAFVIFEEASNLMYEDSKAKALVRLGIARIYFEKGKFNEALRYAISVYVLYDDPVYSPDAMLIAIKILVNQRGFEEARITYKELEKRYPGSLASFKTNEENLVLFNQLL